MESQKRAGYGEGLCDVSWCMSAATQVRKEPFPKKHASAGYQPRYCDEHRAPWRETEYEPIAAPATAQQRAAKPKRKGASA